MSNGDPHLRRAADSLPRDRTDATADAGGAVLVGAQAWTSRAERVRAVVVLAGTVVLVGLAVAILVAVVVAFLAVMVGTALG